MPIQEAGPAQKFVTVSFKESPSFRLTGYLPQDTNLSFNRCDVVPSANFVQGGQVSYGNDKTQPASVTINYPETADPIIPTIEPDGVSVGQCRLRFRPALAAVR